MLYIVTLAASLWVISQIKSMIKFDLFFFDEFCEWSGGLLDLISFPFRWAVFLFIAWFHLTLVILAVGFICGIFTH
jgi:hypothetical protein